jgi:hypothetical protein
MNRHINGNTFALLACCMLLANCDNRRDVLSDQGVWVRVEVDWRQAGIRPEGTSIYLFGQETGERTDLLRTNDMRDSVTCDSFKLHTGRYSLIAFNETERSHDDIAFRGTDSYATAEAYATPLTLRPESRILTLTATRSAVQTTISSADVLAVAPLDLFEVDYGMIRDQTRPQLRLSPQRLTVTVEVIVHVQNIRSLNTGKAQVGALDNMAEGVFLATGTPNDIPATYCYTLGLDSYDAATNSGSLKATFGTFGPLSAASNTLALYFLLRDDTEYVVECDVSGQLRPAGTAPSHLRVETGLDPHIELPELPDDSGGMFEVDVGGWGKGADVDIPI